MAPIIVLLALLFFGSALQGLVGFGQGLIIAPITLVLLGSHCGLTALTTMGLLLNAMLMVREGRPWVRPPLALWLAVPLGLGAGIWVAARAPQGVLAAIAGGSALLLAAALLVVRPRISGRGGLLVVAGGMAAFLQATTTLSGPPLVLTLTGQKRGKHELRVLLFSIFLILGSASLVFYGVAGIFNLGGAMIGIAGAPVAMLAGGESSRGLQLTVRVLRF